MSTTTLPPLDSVTQLSPNVTRILGQNPGRYTLQGTNTYLISHPSTSSLILLDTAQGIESYTPLLQPFLSAQSRLTIILSHWHEDHVNGLPSVLQLVKQIGAPPPSVWKFATGDDKDVQVEALLESAAVATGDHVAKPAVGVGLLDTSTASRIHRLQEGQLFALAAAGDAGAGFVPDGPTLEVVHAPGHTSDSIALLMRLPDVQQPPALFTFDTVLGHGTAVFEDLGAYMSTLQKCIDKLESGSATASSRAVTLYPGHGEVITDGVAKLKEYALHRQQREDQVIESLKVLAEGAEPTTATALCERIYGDSIPDALKLAATRGLVLHLEKLERELKVVRFETSDKGHEVMPGWADGWRWNAGGGDAAKF